MAPKSTATAFAPASIGNVCVGFDMLGLAIAGVGDHVTAERTDTAGISLTDIFDLDGTAHTHLPRENDQNTASIAARALWEAHGDCGGIALRLTKGIPIESGMGSSAASAVAAVVALNALLPTPLAHEQLLPFALAGETQAGGGLHADNVSPSLIGGLVLCPTVLLPQIKQLRSPSGVASVVVHPELCIDTKTARRCLAKQYTIQQWLAQQGYFAGFLAGCACDDYDLIRRSFRDVIIEPQRFAAIRCFAEVQAAALGANALGASISGSGPSIFALSMEADTLHVADAMQRVFRESGIDSQSWISTISAPGAHLEDSP